MSVIFASVYMKFCENTKEEAAKDTFGEKGNEIQREAWAEAASRGDKEPLSCPTPLELEP